MNIHNHVQSLTRGQYEASPHLYECPSWNTTQSYTGPPRVQFFLRELRRSTLLWRFSRSSLSSCKQWPLTEFCGSNFKIVCSYQALSTHKLLIASDKRTHTQWQRLLFNGLGSLSITPGDILIARTIMLLTNVLSGAFGCFLSNCASSSTACAISGECLGSHSFLMWVDCMYSK